VNIVAINASFGGVSNTDAESAAIKAAGDVGIVLCAAAGNDGANNDTIATYPGTSAGVTATLIHCGFGNSAAEFPSSVRNNLALIQRGTQTFAIKVTNAMNAGAVGAIIYNNVTGANFTGTLATAGIWIPAVSVSQADGASLLSWVNTSVTLTNSVTPSSIYQYLDGTSMATPHVVGALAFAAMNFPTETAVRRVKRVLNHTTAVAAMAGKIMSGGRLNLLKMIDTDSNGLPDWWEIDYFGMMGVNPNLDTDADGMTNLGEYLAGTHPRNSASKLSITQAASIPNGMSRSFRITFPSVSGTTYRVESSDTLAPDSWTAHGADLPGTGGNLQATDTATSSHPKRFYRVGVVP
jgi:subtilisin family serine protease